MAWRRSVIATLVGCLLGLGVAQLIIRYLESRPPTATIVHQRRLPNGRWVQKVHKVPVRINPDGTHEWSWSPQKSEEKHD